MNIVSTLIFVPCVYFQPWRRSLHQRVFNNKNVSRDFTLQQGCQSVNPAMHTASRSC